MVHAFFRLMIIAAVTVLSLILAPQLDAIAAEPNADAKAAELKKIRLQCNRLAEKLGNARRLKDNTVEVTSNYNAPKEMCFAQIEITAAPQKAEGQEEETRHRQILLMDANTAELLAIIMWTEPSKLRVGHIYDPQHKGPRDVYEEVDLYMRKKMALNIR